MSGSNLSKEEEIKKAALLAVVRNKNKSGLFENIQKCFSAEQNESIFSRINVLEKMEILKAAVDKLSETGVGTKKLSIMARGKSVDSVKETREAIVNSLYTAIEADVEKCKQEGKVHEAEYMELVLTDCKIKLETPDSTDGLSRKGSVPRSRSGSEVERIQDSEEKIKLLESIRSSDRKQQAKVLEYAEAYIATHGNGVGMSSVDLNIFERMEVLDVLLKSHFNKEKGSKAILDMYVSAIMSNHELDEFKDTTEFEEGIKSVLKKYDKEFQAEYEREQSHEGVQMKNALDMYNQHHELKSSLEYLDSDIYKAKNNPPREAKPT